MNRVIGTTYDNRHPYPDIPKLTTRPVWRYAERHHYWAMYNAMAEDGYDPLVDWAELMKETE
jgi:hypothetical protein